MHDYNLYLPLDHSNIVERLRSFISMEDKLNYLETYSGKVRGCLIDGYCVLYLTNLILKFKEEHFPELDKDLRFSFWFLKYNANWIFIHKINTPEFKEMLDSNDRYKDIQDEIHEIESLENQARELKRQGLINVNTKFNNGGYLHFADLEEKYKYVEILRVKSGNYYENHKTEYPYYTFESPEVKAYAKHILYKDHLTKLLSIETQPFQYDHENKPNWFKVGLLFATGEIFDLYQKFDENGAALARHIMPNNPDAIASIITRSLDGKSENNNNIFALNNRKKIRQIIEYCERENIKMTTHFEDLKKAQFNL